MIVQSNSHALVPQLIVKSLGVSGKRRLELCTTGLCLRNPQAFQNKQYTSLFYKLPYFF